MSFFFLMFFLIFLISPAVEVENYETRGQWFDSKAKQTVVIDFILNFTCLERPILDIYTSRNLKFLIFFIKNT